MTSAGGISRPRAAATLSASTTRTAHVSASIGRDGRGHGCSLAGPSALRCGLCFSRREEGEDDPGTRRGPGGRRGARPRTSQLGAGDPRRDRLAVGQRGDAVVAPAGDERRARDARQPVPHVVVAAGLQLLALAAPLLRGPRRRVAGGAIRPRPVRGWSASHSGVKRVSRMQADRRRLGRRQVRELVQRVRRRPAPPGDVHTSTRRANRSGHVTAISWATIPPKLMPTMAQRSQPTWSSRAAASAA